MFCYKCGIELGEKDQFCNKCGFVVSSIEVVDDDTSNIIVSHENTKPPDFALAGYILVVLGNLITLGVTLAIYTRLYDDFEIIVVSLLILIYLTIQTFTMAHGIVTVESILTTHTEFNKIRKLLKKDENGINDEEFEREEIKEVTQKISKAKIKMYINGVFIFIIYIIAIVNLLGTL